MKWFLQHCSASTLQVNLSGLQPSFIEIWILRSTTLQHQLSQVRFLGIFSATTRPHKFFAATFLLFVMNLFEVKRRKIGCFESLMFAVDLLVNSAVVMFWRCPEISHFTFHISLEVLYDNWLLLKLLTML